MWWIKNGYKVMRVLLWYIWVPAVLYSKLKALRSRRFVENPKRTKRIFDRIFPKLVSKHCESNDIILISLGRDDFYFCDFTSDSIADKYQVGKHASKYFNKLTSERRKIIISNYNIDGYGKELLDSSLKWSCAEEYFGLGHNYYGDSHKAVLFYNTEKYQPDFNKR